MAALLKRAPSRAEWRTCSPYLHFEIRALHPRCILTLGGRAAEVVTLLAPSPHNRAAFKALDRTIDTYRDRLACIFAAFMEDVAPEAGRSPPRVR